MTKRHPTRQTVTTIVAAAALFGAAVAVTGMAGAANPNVNATFTEEGAKGITGGQTEGITNSPVVGAVKTVVAHPTDPNTAWVGSVNGGIWKTTNATAASPSWLPETDQAPSLSISSIDLDPTVGTNLVLGA